MGVRATPPASTKAKVYERRKGFVAVVVVVVAAAFGVKCFLPVVIVWL